MECCMAGRRGGGGGGRSDGDGDGVKEFALSTGGEARTSEHLGATAPIQWAAPKKFANRALGI